MKLKIKENTMKRQATRREEIFAKQIFDRGLASRLYTELVLLSRNSHLPPPNWARNSNTYDGKRH